MLLARDGDTGLDACGVRYVEIGAAPRFSCCRAAISEDLVSSGFGAGRAANSPDLATTGLRQSEQQDPLREAANRDDRRVDDGGARLLNGRAIDPAYRYNSRSALL